MSTFLLFLELAVVLAMIYFGAKVGTHTGHAPLYRHRGLHQGRVYDQIQ